MPSTCAEASGGLASVLGHGPPVAAFKNTWSALTPSRSKGVSKTAMSLHRVRLLSPVTHGTRARPPRSICGSTFKLPFISGCRCIIPIPIAIPPPSASCVSEPRPRARNSGLPWAASNGMLGLSLQFLLYLQGWHAHSPEFLAQALDRGRRPHKYERLVVIQPRLS